MTGGLSHPVGVVAAPAVPVPSPAVKMSDPVLGIRIGVIPWFRRIGDAMTDLKFEQKRSLSRLEAADQLTALAAALRQGGDVSLELGSGTLSLRIPDDLRSEIEVEVGDGEIELEIEFTWPISHGEAAPPAAGTGTAATARRRRSTPAKAARSSTGTSRSKSAKRTAAKAS